jgi:hypothetical protein
MGLRFPTWFAVFSIACVVSSGLRAHSRSGALQESPVGITVDGWHGSVDPNPAPDAVQPTISDTSLVSEGDGIRIVTGPAALYWQPSRFVTGEFSASATFTEARQSSDHPHPYGLFIGGHQLGMDQSATLYCVAYADGTFLVRQIIGSNITTLSPKSPHASVTRRDHADAAVTQKIAWSVRDGRAACAINDAVVWSAAVTDLTGAGALETLDGLVGIRVGQQTNVLVTEFVIQ